MKEKQKKQIDLPLDVVKALTHQAIEAGSNFKNYVEQLLADQAKVTK